jgi:flavorubredoxin
LLSRCCGIASRGVRPVSRELPLVRDAAAAFGSFGWSGGSPKLTQQHRENAGFSVVEEPLACKWQPGGEDLDKC